MARTKGTWRPGAIVWRELAATDLERATAFYTELLGWTHHDSPGAGGEPYRHFEANGESVAGAYQLGPDRGGVPSHWAHYVSVEDVDARAARARDLGGTVQMSMDLPGVGRVAWVRDPQGGSIVLFRDQAGDEPPAKPPYPTGTFCWETLNTSDKAAAVAFYEALIGWTATDFYGNTTVGTGYQPGDGVADVQQAPPGVPSHWMSHVTVASVDDARARAVSLGATVLGEADVPTVGRMVFVQDPVGAVVSLYEALPA